jgi:hypothetical protein
MSDRNGKADSPEGALEVLAERLAREAGITLEQAPGLIKLIGSDWNSLLREAHFLKGRH